MSDVTFSVGGKRIQAHRNVLATWSEVFRQMFVSETRGEESRRYHVLHIFFQLLSSAESRGETVVIEQAEPAAFESMLRFMYTHELYLNSETALDVFDSLVQLSDRYQVKELKELRSKVRKAVVFSFYTLLAVLPCE